MKFYSGMQMNKAQWYTYSHKGWYSLPNSYTRICIILNSVSGFLYDLVIVSDFTKKYSSTVSKINLLYQQKKTTDKKPSMLFTINWQFQLALYTVHIKILSISLLLTIRIQHEWLFFKRVRIVGRCRGLCTLLWGLLKLFFAKDALLTT